MATTALSVVRLSGAAVAVGIGAAVATGLAASAWAAPEDSGDGRSARTAAAAEPAGPARDGGVRTAAGRAVAAGPVRRSGKAAPARATTPPATTDAAVAAPRATAAVARRNAAPAPTPAPAPAPVPMVLPAPAPAPQPTAATSPARSVAPGAGRSARAERSGPLLSWLCPDPRGRLITIYKRTHFAIPNNFGFFVRNVTGTGTFTANSAYDLGDEDQYDWNKFTGIAFTPLEPDRNSVMVGWRYNLNTQQFEIAPFYNVDKKRILPNEQTEVISVPVDETFNYVVDYTGVTVSYGDQTVFKPFPEGLTPNVWTAARVSGWFGGNEAAPRTISYFINFA